MCGSDSDMSRPNNGPARLLLFRLGAWIRSRIGRPEVRAAAWVVAAGLQVHPLRLALAEAGGVCGITEDRFCR